MAMSQEQIAIGYWAPSRWFPKEGNMLRRIGMKASVLTMLLAGTLGWIPLINSQLLPRASRRPFRER